MCMRVACNLGGMQIRLMDDEITGSVQPADSGIVQRDWVGVMLFLVLVSFVPAQHYGHFFVHLLRFEYLLIRRDITSNAGYLDDADSYRGCICSRLCGRPDH